MRLTFLYFLLILGACFLLTSCRGCSESGKKQAQIEKSKRNSEKNNTTQDEKQYQATSESEDVPSKRTTIVRLRKEGGVFLLPVKINGLMRDFIFDTGASSISISTKEAGLLYKRGSLTESDFLGTANYMDANGDVTEGTIINLKTVQVGNRILRNVNASVVHSPDAPLLLGQSFLLRFGKVTIDNENQTITLE